MRSPGQSLKWRQWVENGHRRGRLVSDRHPRLRVVSGPLLHRGHSVPEIFGLPFAGDSTRSGGSLSLTPSAPTSETNGAAGVGADGGTASVACTLKSDAVTGSEVGDNGAARIARVGENNSTTANDCGVVDGDSVSAA